MERTERRALVVDGDPEMSRLIRRCLSMWGWASDECRTASEALSRFKSARYELMLCDARLPDGSGIELARSLMRVNPLLVAIIVSGHPDNVDRARSAGVARRLHKPFDLEALRALVVSSEKSG